MRWRDQTLIDHSVGSKQQTTRELWTTSWLRSSTYSTVILLIVGVLCTSNGVEATRLAGTRCTRNSLNLGNIIGQLMEGYDTHLLPEADGVNVTIELHVQGVSGISEITGDFELDIMYSEIWLDPRLSFKSDFREKMWTPTICIINSKDAAIHRSPSENTFVILYEHGLVWSNFRLKVKAPCKMDLKMFPFDSIQCQLVFESYSFNTDEVRLLWHDVPVTMMENVELPDFDLIGWSTDHQRLEYPNGVWDRAQVKFTFARRYGFYLFQSYFPTSLTVISSWVTFLSLTSKVGVFSLLALTFQFGNVLRHLPRVSYIKCLDVWMIFSVIFIFCTLVEMAIVCQLSRWERERQIGSKVLGHWLNQIRKTRKNDGKSNGSEANGLKKRFLLKPISPPVTPKLDRDASPADAVTPTTESVASPRGRLVNAFKRAASGSPSPQLSTNDLTSAATTPLTNAITKPGDDEEEVSFATGRQSKRKRLWQDIVSRVSQLWSKDREWTLTSIQLLCIPSATQMSTGFFRLGGLVPDYQCLDSNNTFYLTSNEVRRNSSHACSMVKGCSNLQTHNAWVSIYEEFMWVCEPDYIGSTISSLLPILHLIAHFFSGHLTGICAYFIGHWRRLLLIMNIFGIPAVFLLGFFVESPRFLIQNGKYQQAATSMNRIAWFNGKDTRFTADDMHMIQSFSASHAPRNKKVYILASVLKLASCILFDFSDDYWKLVFKTNFTFNIKFVVSVNILHAVIFFNIQDLSGNPLMNVSLMGLLRLWTPFIAILLETKFKQFGRKRLMVGSLSMTMLCFMVMLVIDVLELPGTARTIGTSAVMLAGLVWIAYKLYTTELFPTVIRSIALGTFSIAAQFGSIVGPQLIYIRKYWHSAPYAACVCALFLATVLAAILLPETKSEGLLDTVHDAKRRLLAFERSQQKRSLILTSKDEQTSPEQQPLTKI
ncbi:Ligand-gated ion channel 50 [Aphelenchoides besseyi]|nr:Ligand-gated ion channel 50 [Aphelenchoides besseyi]